MCGIDWALLGDAAGFADPITAEGIYFSLRSAEILGESLSNGNPLGYENAWRNDFGIDLQKAAAWRDRFYGGTLLFQAFTRRAVQLTRSSPTVRQTTDGLVSGNSSYRRLQRRLILSSPRILIEALRSNFRGASRNSSTPVSAD